jgi:hypothetical protein
VPPCGSSGDQATGPPRIRDGTVNRPLEDWGKLIGDVPAATAILDRFLHNAEVIAITGKSYRLRNHAAADAEQSKQRGRRSTADDEGLSPPEDTDARKPVSSGSGGQLTQT